MLRFSLCLLHFIFLKHCKCSIDCAFTLWQHCHYGWVWVTFMHTPRNKPKQQDKWNYFVDQFHELLKVVQELIFVKLHEGIKVWTLEKGIVTIYVEGLTKYTRWLPIVVCLLTLTKIINIFIIRNHYLFKMNIGFHIKH
jgi:hypothetical protein